MERGTGFGGGVEIGGGCRGVGGGSSGGGEVPLSGGCIVFAKQKGTVHRSAPQLLYIITLSNAKHGRKYWNRSRGKLDFKGSSGKDYGTRGLN